MVFHLLVSDKFGSEVALLGDWFIAGKMYNGVLNINIKNPKSTKLTLRVDDDFKFIKHQNIEGVVLDCKYFLYNCNLTVDSSCENLKSFSCEYLFIDQYSLMLEDTFNPEFNFKCHSLSVSIDDYSIRNYLNEYSFSKIPSLICDFDDSTANIKYTPSKKLTFFSNFNTSGILEINFKEEQDFIKLVSTLDLFSDFIFLFFNRYLNYSYYFLQKNLHGEVVEKSEFPNGNYPVFGIFYDKFIPYDLLFDPKSRHSTHNSSYKPTNIFKNPSNNLSTYFNRFLDYSNSNETLYSDMVNLFVYATSGKITESLQIFQSQITVLEGLFRFLYIKKSNVFKKKYNTNLKKIHLKVKLSDLINLSVIDDNINYSNIRCKDFFQDYLDTYLNESNICLDDIVGLRNYATHLTKKKSFTNITEPFNLNKVIAYNHVLITFYLLYNLDVIPSELDDIISSHFSYLKTL